MLFTYYLDSEHNISKNSKTFDVGNQGHGLEQTNMVELNPLIYCKNV